MCCWMIYFGAIHRLSSSDLLRSVIKLSQTVLLIFFLFQSLSHVLSSPTFSVQLAALQVTSIIFALVYYCWPWYPSLKMFDLHLFLFKSLRSNLIFNLHQCLAEIVSGNSTVAGAVLNCTGREGKQLISQVIISPRDLTIVLRSSRSYSSVSSLLFGLLW